MAAKLIVAREAEQDIAEAYAWYEARRAGLGGGLPQLRRRVYPGDSPYGRNARGRT
jgi:hypothetical protein